MGEEKGGDSVRKCGNGESLNRKVGLKMRRGSGKSGIREGGMSCLVGLWLGCVSKERGVVRRGVMEIIKGRLVV